MTTGGGREFCFGKEAIAQTTKRGIINVIYFNNEAVAKTTKKGL